jgi:glutathione S-transferase
VIRVWGIGTSRTIRPHWALAELGVEYETRAIIPRTPSMEDPEFLSVSRRGKVPILEHDDLVIGESGAIVFWLAEHFRDRDRVELAPERSRQSGERPSARSSTTCACSS